MAKRKAWKDLSPAYQQRLRRHGITPATHKNGKSLRGARGHGPTTPASVRNARQRMEKLHAQGNTRNKRVDESLIKQSNAMSIPPEESQYALISWPAEFTQMMLDYRKYRYSQWKDSGHKAKYYDLISLDDYMDMMDIEPGVEWPLYIAEAENTAYNFYRSI